MAEYHEFGYDSVDWSPLEGVNKQHDFNTLRFFLTERMVIEHELDVQLLFRTKAVTRKLAADDEKTRREWTDYHAQYAGMTAELAGQRYLEDAFLFDMDDEKCFWGQLGALADVDAVGAVDLLTAHDRAAGYTEHNEKLEKKSEKQFK